jgi:hypothetical protein
MQMDFEYSVRAPTYSAIPEVYPAPTR